MKIFCFILVYGTLALALVWNLKEALEKRNGLLTFAAELAVLAVGIAFLLYGNYVEIPLYL